MQNSFLKNLEIYINTLQLVIGVPLCASFISSFHESDIKRINKCRERVFFN